MLIKTVTRVSLFMIVLLGTTNIFANLVKADRSISCGIANGWSLNLDLFWQGHPQGPGGWSAAGQFNDWGKFMLTRYNSDDIFYGVSTGHSRLDHYEVKIFLQDQKLEYRTSGGMGQYSEWKEYDLICK